MTPHDDNPEPLKDDSRDASHEPTDEDLLREIARGDEPAFETLVHRYEARIRRFVWSFSSDPAEADDLAQETFLKVLKSAGGYRGEGSAAGWLFRIATRTGIDARRRRIRRAETALIPGMEPPSPATVETDYESCQRLERAWKGMDQLSEASRLALLLREIEGLSYREMSEALDCPVGTVLSRVSRARNELLSILKDPPRRPDAEAEEEEDGP